MFKSAFKQKFLSYRFMSVCSLINVAWTEQFEFTVNTYNFCSKSNLQKIRVDVKCWQQAGRWTTIIRGPSKVF